MSGVLEFTESYFKKDVQILSNIGLDTFIKIVSINNTKTKTIENSKKDYDLLKKLCNKVLSNREDDNGFISRKIKYKQINNGRYFLNDDVGMQNMTRNIRAILSHRHLYDVDMVNAQPSILLKVCDENEIECDYASLGLRNMIVKYVYNFNNNPFLKLIVQYTYNCMQMLYMISLALFMRIEIWLVCVIGTKEHQPQPHFAV
jgi:hypothetical protein